jgi:hypothetical protein
MHIKHKLYKVGKELIIKRHPSDRGDTTTMYTERGKMLTSFAPKAYKLNTKITHY